MDVSVVIPTFNRGQLLKRTVPALADQRVDDLRYEVVFVIDGSTDGSESLLREASSKWPEKIRYFYIENSGTPSAPRNRGIREAMGAVLILLDDDVIPDPDLIERYAEFHRQHPEPHHAAVGELYLPEEALDEPITIYHDMFRYDRFRGLDRLSFQDFWTCNVSLKRSFMLEHGMFDESMPFFEDPECGYRLVSNGMHLHFLPEARGQHWHGTVRLKNLAGRARMIGRALYDFERRVPVREAREIRVRHGVLSWDLPPRILLRRLFNRAGFVAVGNPISRRVLKAMVGKSSKRNRITDLYYHVLLRHNMRVGYRAAKRGVDLGDPMWVG